MRKLILLPAFLALAALLVSDAAADTDSHKILFLHYWGVGPTADLAKAIKAALDTQK